MEHGGSVLLEIPEEWERNELAQAGSKGSVGASRSYIALLGFGALLSLLVALQGLIVFLSGNYGQGIGDAIPSVFEELGFIAWMVLAPFSGILALACTLAVLKHSPEFKALKFSWLGLLVVLMVAAFAISTYLARDLLQCGVFFCSNDQPPYVNDIKGLWVSLALGWLVLSIVLGITFVVTAFVLERPGTEQKLRPLTSRLRRNQMRRRFAASCLALFIIPFCVLITGLLPNQYPNLQLSGLPSYMASEVKSSDHVWMQTLNIRLSSNVVLKLYPDVLMFYAFLEVLAVASILAATLPAFKRWLGKHGVGNFSIGECCVLLLFLVLMAFWLFYWLFEHGYVGDTRDYKWATGSKENLARTFGQVAVLLMSVTLLPATKNSIWLQALGISWEKSMWVHRCVGKACIVGMLAHVIGFWTVWGSLGVLWHDILAIPAFYPWNPASTVEYKPKVAVGDDWTIPMMEIIGYPAILAMGLPWLRRRANYKIFKYFHYVFLALIPATLLHATSGWYYMLGGVAFWLVDLAIRFTTTARPTKVLSLTPHDAEGGVTELCFEKAFEEPGGYCFVNVPAISAFDWHPFSLSSSPLDGVAQMCIKNMGPGTFTGKLYELAKVHDEASSLVLNIDGPYGPSLDPSDYSAIVLLAGGIGITGMHSTFRMLSQLAERGELPETVKLVRLIWTGRSMALFRVFLEALAQFSQPGRFEVVLYLTSGDTECPPAEAVRILPGRPSFDAIFDELEHFKEKGPVLVKSCGPAPMILASQKAAHGRKHIHYESELFVL
jgi:predicted ferric reductase